MLKLESLLTFVTTADVGSISEAARRLQISKSVASERLVDLERTVGATLMHRSTRKLTLTEDGVVFLERARRILHDVAEATAEVSDRRGALVGPLRVSAPVSFGLLHLWPAVSAFLRRYPRIDLSLDLNDRFVGATDGFDAVIRHGPAPGKGWRTLSIAPSRRVLVASPAYLKANRAPRSLEDLARHRGIIYSNRGASDWRFRQSDRWSVVRPRASLRVNNGILMREAALEGLGIALLATFIVHDHLAAGRLSVVDIGAEAESATIFVAYPTDRQVSPKVLALAEHLRSTFGPLPYWDQWT